MRKFFTLSGLLIVIFSGMVFGQKRVGFEFDYARFQIDNNTSYLELYYDIKLGDFSITDADNMHKIQGKMHIEIAPDPGKKNLYEKDFPFEEKYAEITDEIKVKSEIGVLGVRIPKGNYTLKVKVTDTNNGRESKEIIEKIKIEPYNDKITALSDIELAANIFSDGADKNSIYYKNTMEVVPNPSTVYAAAAPVLFYYLELYNLSVNNPNKTYKLIRTLYNSGRVQMTTSSKFVNQKSPASVEVGSINLLKYPTDNYTLEVALVDTSTKNAIMVTKTLYLYNNTIKQAQVADNGDSDFQSSEYAVMGEKECNDMFEQTKIIASKGELDQMERVYTFDGKKKFLFIFWKSRNKNVSTGINASRTEFDKRVAYANKEFSNSFTIGWHTDRGRNTIKYGIPDNIERHPVEGNTEAYEIWTYINVEEQHNVIFVFGDVGGFGSYVLMHTTLLNEMYDSAWLQKLQKR